MIRYFKEGPPTLAIAALLALATAYVGVRAQSNIATMFGCTSITNCSSPLANIPLLLDSSGRIQAHVTGAIGPLTAPLAVNTTALGTTSTDGISTSNTTAATAGATVQISPRFKWCGAAWNSVGAASETDCFVAEVLPATNAGATTATWKLGVSLAGGAVTYPLIVSGAGNVTTLGSFVTASAGQLSFGSRAVQSSSADGLYTVTNSAGTFGPQFNTGTAAPTVTTCGTGSVTAHSSNTAGEVTATGATACTVVFGAPNFTNQPFCVIEDETSAVAQRISAISTSQFTVTALTSGDKFMYHCFGGI